MKKILLILCLFWSFLFADLSIGQIETMVSKIKKKRITTSSKTVIEGQPFIQIKQEDNKSVIVKVIKKEVHFSLFGIINNKANINKVWVQIGDKIDGYRLIDIDNRKVELKNKNKTIVLFLKKKEHFLNLSED